MIVDGAVLDTAAFTVNDPWTGQKPLERDRNDSPKMDASYDSGMLLAAVAIISWPCVDTSAV